MHELNEKYGPKIIIRNTSRTKKYKKKNIQRLKTKI
jgi:hypothetical protein